MDYKMVIPGLLTLTNLLSGCIAIVLCLNGHLDKVYIAVAIALVADYSDGFAARLLKTQSLIGKDLDSLADMVSFGVLPSCIVYEMFMLNNQPGKGLLYAGYLGFFSFILALFAALRLAKFNNDCERQSKEFIGLPTPGMTLLILGYYFLIGNSEPRTYLLSWPLALLICVLSSFLMVVPIPMFSFKLKSIKLKDNPYQYTLVAISLILVCALQKQSLFFIVICYIVTSIVKSFKEHTLFIKA